ncbi:hypothetical protein Cni_G20522 [Canna indica]|uniref:non-specific serine/threonine protein kinase n=1 Tax=Canna indica TaxID=4628 RepID=A0AAQ3QJK3_9LILI|nr:hypothetical protein Cni_G20522 [Canna indica]
MVKRSNMAVLHYSSPPLPTCNSSPLSHLSDSYNASQPSSPPLSNADSPLPPSPPPPPMSSSPVQPPASQPQSFIVDAYSPAPETSSPPSLNNSPPPESSPPPIPILPPTPPSAAPPLASPLSQMLPSAPPPAAIPPLSPVYYRSPPPPPAPPQYVPPSSSPQPSPTLPLAPPPKNISYSPPPSIHNSTSPVSSPLPHKSRPSLPLAAPVKPNTPTSSNSTGSAHPRSGSPKSSMATAGTVATVAVVAGLVMLTFVGAAVWLVTKKKKSIGPIMASSVSSHASESFHARSPSHPLVRHGLAGSYRFPYSTSDLGLGHTKLWFTLEELSIITNNFSTQNLLGEGGCASVYKGCLRDGREVAVKQLKIGGTQGEREFKAEVETISRVHHRHLVSLVGYCVSGNERLLVYDYVPNRTLYYHLHGKGRPIMEWTIRVQVASGTARGIAYLHEDCHPQIIHRDIKSSNILLDYNFEAQVSDFGLARSAMDSNTHETTQVMGTFGYLAPEYATSGKLTYKSDVYSFGVVLLELITGRKPVDASQPLGDESLVEWARPLLFKALENGDFGSLPDPRLEGNFHKDEMFCMIEIAAACIRHSSTMRPRMGQVVRALEGLNDLDINNGVRPGQSEIFSSSPGSEEIRMFQRMGFASQENSSDYSRVS